VIDEIRIARTTIAAITNRISVAIMDIATDPPSRITRRKIIVTSFVFEIFGISLPYDKVLTWKDISTFTAVGLKYEGLFRYGFCIEICFSLRAFIT
jgi:hypothetical protein